MLVTEIDLTVVIISGCLVVVVIISGWLVVVGTSIVDKKIVLYNS